LSHLEIPHGISLNALVGIIAAWHRAQAHRQEVTIYDAARTVRVKPQTVQGQVGFLRQLGLIQGTNTFKLTPVGEKLARFADFSKGPEFWETMGFTIRNWKELLPLREYIAESPATDKESVVKRILMLSNEEIDSRTARVGAETLFDLLKSSGMVELVDGKAVVSEKWHEDAQPPTTAPEIGPAPAPEREYPQVAPSTPQELPVFIEKMMIRNIRSIVQTEIPLKKMNIFIGRNASGKSSILYSLLALRNLKWGRTFADSSYGEMEWLRRRRSIEPMILRLTGKIAIQNRSYNGELLVAFTPALSYCSQLCVSADDDWICDTSIFNRGDLVLPVEYMKGLKDLRELPSKAREGVESVFKLLRSMIDVDPTVSRTVAGGQETSISFMEDKDGGFEKNIQTRRLLGAWPGLLPSFMLKDSKGDLRESYLAARPAFASMIDSVEFVPVMRGFLLLTYPQQDSPPQRVPDTIDFVAQLLNKMIFPDAVDHAILKKLQDWAEKFGVRNFEAVLQPSRQIEARGWIWDKQTKLPIALYGFGSNQVLALIGKCLFAPEKAPILIEEPEIHLHPEMQALAADFLTDIMKNGHQLFVSTHSEHLIGRLQRRIAEGQIGKDDIAILWVKQDSESQGTVVEEVKIGEDGILHKGLLTYMSFLEEEIKATQRARQKSKKREE